MAAIRNFVLVRFLRTTVSLTLYSTTRKPAALYLRRFGRRTNSPPQLGQTLFISAAHFSHSCLISKAMQLLNVCECSSGKGCRTPSYGRMLLSRVFWAGSGGVLETV